MQREFANPTGLLEEVMRPEIHPLQKKTEGIVRELLGPHVSEQDVQFCETSIISQCVNPMIVRKRSQDKDKAQTEPQRIKDINANAEHVLRFSLAGMKAIRKNAESK